MKIFILTICLLFQFNLSAQKQDKHKIIYGSIDLDVGNYLGIDGSINYIYNNDYVVSVGGSFFWRSSNSKPNDYKKQLINPKDFIENIHLLVGKYFYFI